MGSKRRMPSAYAATNDEDEQIECDSFAYTMVVDVSIDPSPGAARRPKTIEEGIQDPRRKEALMREFTAHTKQHTFDVVDKTDDMQLLCMMMLQTEKYDNNGQLDRFKARMVINGSHQERK